VASNLKKIGQRLFITHIGTSQPCAITKSSILSAVTVEQLAYKRLQLVVDEQSVTSPR